MTRAIVVIALELVACAKHDTDKPPPAAPPPAAPPPAYRLSCDRLIPKVVRDQLLDGAEPKEHITSLQATVIADCSFTKQDTFVMITCCADCDDAALTSTMRNGLPPLSSPAELPGIGRMAVRGQTQGVQVVQFRDDDTSCYGMVTGGTRGVELTKALVLSINPKTIN